MNHSVVIHRFHRLQDATLFVFHLSTLSMETWNSEWDLAPLIIYLALQLPSFWAFHQHHVLFRIISSLYFSKIISALLNSFFLKNDIWIWLERVNWINILYLSTKWKIYYICLNIVYSTYNKITIFLRYFVY